MAFAATPQHVTAFFKQHRTALLYGLCLAILLFLLKWLEVRLLIVHHSIEIYIGAIAILFTLLGIWLALKIAKPQVKVVEVEKWVTEENEGQAFEVNEAEMLRLGISKRELDVLHLMEEGLSNQEIASRLFVSLNTVKSHTARIFEKLDVKRRTQAVQKAKALYLIA